MSPLNPPPPPKISFRAVLLPLSIYSAFQNIHIHQSSWQFIYKAVTLLMLARIDKQLSGQNQHGRNKHRKTSCRSFCLISPRNPLEDATSSVPPGDMQFFCFFHVRERDKLKEAEFKRANRKCLLLSPRSRGHTASPGATIKTNTLLSSLLFSYNFSPSWFQDSHLQTQETVQASSWPLLK